MASRKPDGTRLQVIVQDAKGNILPDAVVQLRPVGGSGEAVKLAWDKRTGRHVAAGLPHGPATLVASRRGAEPQSRTITIGASPAEEVVILGKKGGRTYFRGKVRVPVEAEPGLVGVTFARRTQADSLADELEGLAGLKSRKVPEAAARLGMRLFELTGADTGNVLERLEQHPLVEFAGAVVATREAGFTHLTRDVVVQFRGRSADQVQSIAKELGYALVRELPYAPSTFVLRWDRPATLDILDSIERLAARDDVEWAEPNLVNTPEVDAIVPNDYLWPGLWDRQLIGVQHAYQHLQDAGLPPFGDPDLILAVYDSGVQSVGGVPTNADFAGTVSNGQPKLFATFDFGAMVANNDNPWLDHGSGVAGVAAANANNPSPVAGVGYGVSGAAPNVRIMTIESGSTDDLSVADTYIWMAGFDPQSTTAGFPAPLPRGADIITCSLALGPGAPLSGIGRAALDFVTTFGRGGKGTMCFFSTGNGNSNNIANRPYGAYEKCFAIAATSFANDGVTEIRAPYSGWGQIAFCAPSHDQYPPFHNPPTGFATWGGDHQGLGNLISFPQTQTTLAAASAAGATSITVASTAGIAVNSVLHIGAIGAVGSEPAKVTAVNSGTGQLTVQGFSPGSDSFMGGLIAAHAAGTVVATGPANHCNNFGGTSSATPLAAGAAALVLSANPSLTYIEVREILRSTAVKFDLANTDPNGQWLDADGNPSVTSGQPAVKSAWYGYGRIDAGAAVEAAVSFLQTRDLVIRDNIADTGAVASSGAFWDSPDIWCRRLAPAVDGAAALPASYGDPGPHLDPERGQNNWVYLRVRNNGTTASLDAWVRVSVAHYPGMEFTYPASWQPTNGPGDVIPAPMMPGTYFIGEVKLGSLPPGGEQIVNLLWPEALIPPENVPTGSGTVEWHPCLLAEITPHDGPAASGNHVWDDNNLAQKNISTIDMVVDSDFQTGLVLGHEDNRADFLTLEVNRGSLPRQVQLSVEILDPVLKRRFQKISQAALPRLSAVPDLLGVEEFIIDAIKAKLPRDLVAAAKAMLEARRRWQAGGHRGRDAILLTADRKVQIPLPIGAGRLATVAVGGIVQKDAPPGDYDVVLIQRQPDGEVSGSAALRLSIAPKRKKSRRVPVRP